MFFEINDTRIRVDLRTSEIVLNVSAPFPFLPFSCLLLATVRRCESGTVVIRQTPLAE
jgi:hypothetical protein